MKTYKIRMKDYTNYEQMLIRVGAVLNDRAYPGRVYWNSDDIKLSRKLLTEECKKTKKYTKNGVANAVGMYMLNLSPSELKCNPLRDGYMLVDDIGIAQDIVAEKIEE